MNQKKQSALLRKQTIVAKRIFELIPIQEPVSKNSIVAECRRQGHTADKRIVEGVLDSLVGDGLVKEPRLGEFVRAPVSKPVIVPTLKEHHKEEAPVTKAVSITKNKTLEPTEELLRLAEIAEGLSNEVQALAEKINEASLSLEEKMASDQKELELFRQFKAMMKD